VISSSPERIPRGESHKAYAIDAIVEVKASAAVIPIEKWQNDVDKASK
jgi:hypothetical protein